MQKTKQRSRNVSVSVGKKEGEKTHQSHTLVPQIVNSQPALDPSIPLVRWLFRCRLQAAHFVEELCLALSLPSR